MAFYTDWIHSRNQFSLIQNVGKVLQYRTLSCFVTNFVMLISMMYCERLILLIQSNPIPFFECELDAGGTIHIFVIATRTQRRTWCGRAALPYPSGGGVERSWHASCPSRAIATRPRPHRACSAAAWRCPPSSCRGKGGS
jgi:hypothetical protein